MNKITEEELQNVKDGREKVSTIAEYLSELVLQQTVLDNLVKNTKNVFLSRQNSPEVYDLNASFYWYRRSFFETQNNSPITNKSIIYKMDHICFDIDEPIDFYFLEFLIETERIKGIL